MAQTADSKKTPGSTLREDVALFEAMEESPKRRNGTNIWKNICRLYNRMVSGRMIKTILYTINIINQRINNKYYSFYPFR